MSEMVERVARAMMYADWGSDRTPPPDVSIKNYYAMARAAIEAMREPTAGMVEATEGWDSHRVAWQLMIDAALTPSE